MSVVVCTRGAASGWPKGRGPSLIPSRRERTLDQFLATSNSNKPRGTRRDYFSATSATHRGTLTQTTHSLPFRLFHFEPYSHLSPYLLDKTGNHRRTKDAPKTKEAKRGSRESSSRAKKESRNESIRVALDDRETTSQRIRSRFSFDFGFACT